MLVSWAFSLPLCLNACTYVILKSPGFTIPLTNLKHLNDTEKYFEFKDAVLIHDCMHCKNKTAVSVCPGRKTAKSGLCRQSAIIIFLT